MPTSLIFVAAALLAALAPVLGATYAQTDSHTGTGFLKSFSVQAIADPTHGRVYVKSNSDLTCLG